MEQTVPERIFYTLMIVLIPQVSDYVMSETRQQLPRALLDNATHIMIGVLTWLIIEPASIKSTRLCWNLMTVATLSSLIDIDHLIAAKSFYPKDAFNAPHRGIFHCSVLMLILNLVCFCLNFEWGVLWMVSWIPHHLRDSTRRGLYLLPTIHTHPISSDLVNILTIILPWLTLYIRTKFLFSLNQPIRGVFNV